MAQMVDTNPLDSVGWSMTLLPQSWQGCAKLTDFEWIFGYESKNFRNFRFWLRFPIRIHYFDTFGRNFKQAIIISSLLVLISKYKAYYYGFYVSLLPHLGIDF